MKRRKRDISWPIALGGVLAGLLLGLWFGYRLLPQLAGTDLSDLDARQKDQYVALVALGYSQSGDLERASEQLAALQAPNNGQLVAGVGERYINNGGKPNEISALAQLAAALGVQNNALVAFLPTPTRPPATPTPLPPTPTPQPPTPTTAPTATPTPTVEPPTATPVVEAPAATAEPTVTATSAPAPFVVASSAVNVRRGPSVDHPLAGALAAGERAEIVGRNTAGDWWQILLGDGSEGWIYGPIIEVQGDTSGVTVAANIPTPPPPPPTSVPQPTQPPAPKPAGVDFRLVSVRLWGVQENGGYFDGPSLHCGEKRQLRGITLDAAGQPLNGVTMLGVYSNVEQVSGSKGDGRAEWILGGGDDLIVLRDVDGRQVSSERASNLVTDPARIPDEHLMAAGYCSDAASCNALRATNACSGHYSWDVTFQRTY